MVNLLTTVSTWLSDNARELVLLAGLAFLHVGLGHVAAAPGADWYIPGGVLTAIAIFGVRRVTNAAPRRKKEQ